MLSVTEEYIRLMRAPSLYEDANENENGPEGGALKYEKIGYYKVKDYVERPHEYKE